MLSWQAVNSSNAKQSTGKATTLKVMPVACIQTCANGDRSYGPPVDWGAPNPKPQNGQDRPYRLSAVPQIAFYAQSTTNRKVHLSCGVVDRSLMQAGR
jgi:hypothetical protein